MNMRCFGPGISLLIVMTLLLGGVYPLVITGLSKLVFASQATGSLVERDGRVVGSSLIGQSFSGGKYFWGRPSATTPQPYNAIASGGSNLGPLNPALTTRVAASVDALHKADPQNHAAIPSDLVTTSASGLDPDITPAAAQYQARRVAQARGIPLETVRALIAANQTNAFLNFLGEPRVNVLALNLALDARK